jgi:fatty acid desaturase
MKMTIKANESEQSSPLVLIVHPVLLALIILIAFSAAIWFMGIVVTFLLFLIVVVAIKAVCFFGLQRQQDSQGLVDRKYISNSYREHE